jgi:hypothetical protein
MNSDPKNRQYLTFDPSKGYPTGKDLFYECLKCGDVIPSMPDDDIYCKCRNIMLDVGFSRMKIFDHSKVRLFRLKN